MAASAWTLYTKSDLALGNASINLGSANFNAILVTNSYTPAPNSDALYSDVSANELTTSGGYTVGGVSLSGVTWTQSSGTNTFTCTSPTWASFTNTFRYIVIVKRAGGSLVAGDLLLCYCDATGSGSLTGGGGTLTISINASGVFTSTHSP